MPARILIVDDEPSLLRLTEYTLRMEGYEVLTADNGQKALAVVKEQRPDLVILDVMLPDISGQDVCRQLRDVPETADLPVIMLSARVQVADRIQGIKAGADEYVTKPVDSDELLARVEGLLRRHQGQHASEPPRGRTLAVWGARGGVGTSTVAARTALALVPEQRQVILADLVPGFGTLTSRLGMADGSPGAGVFEGEITVDAVRRRLVAHPSGLQVLIHPQDPGRYHEPEPAQIIAVVEMLAGLASWVVLDLSGHPFGLRDLASRCDDVCIVLDPDTESIDLAARRIELLTRWGVRKEALGAVVVSRSVPLRYTVEQLDQHLQPRLGCPVVGAIQPSGELNHRQQSLEANLGMGDTEPFESSVRAFSQRLVEDASSG